MLLRRALLSLLLLCLFAQRLAAAEVEDLETETTVLPSGLAVVLYQDHSQPQVTVAVRYRAGAERDPRLRSGLAHLVEHLLFHRTSHMPYGVDAHALLTRMRALRANGETFEDHVLYYESVPTDNLELALWLESERMRFGLADLSDDSLERERDVVRSERRLRLEAAPYGALNGLLRAALFPFTHPYHNLPVGTEEDLARITLEDVRRFYLDHYRPENAVLVIAGDLQRSHALREAARYFGALRSTTAPPAPSSPSAWPEAPAPGLLQRSEALGRRPLLTLGFVTPADLSPEDAQADVVAALLCREGRGRLDRRLEALPRSNAGAVQRSRAQHSTLQILVLLGEPALGPAALALLQAELGALARGEVQEEELARARRYVISARLGALDGLGISRLLARYHQQGGRTNSLHRDLERYRMVTPQAIASFAQRYLRAEQGVQLLLTPRSASPSEAPDEIPVNEGALR